MGCLFTQVWLDAYLTPIRLREGAAPLRRSAEGVRHTGCFPAIAEGIERFGSESCGKADSSEGFAPRLWGKVGIGVATMVELVERGIRIHP